MSASLGSRSACLRDHLESKVGCARSLDRTRPPQFDPRGVETLEEADAVAEQQGDEVDLAL